MLINVPQYINVEDKIAGPLTAKQLGWIVGLGIILLILWNMVPKVLFFILALPLVILFGALAFYKPYGQPFGNFLVFAVMYFFRPKIYFWRRTPQRAVEKPMQETKAPENTISEKKITSESLKNLAQLLDSEGTQYHKDLEGILKKVPLKK